MTISHFANPAHEEFASLAAFPDFGGFPLCGAGSKPAGNVVPQQPSPPMTSDGSPDSSTHVPSDAVNALGDYDDDDAETGSEDLGSDKKRAGGTNKRGKANSAERRATHNAIERARRESLNGRFLELANALPTMVNVKRPSKSVIVNKSLEYIYESQVREHALVRENNALRAELNDMRARMQMPSLSNNVSPTGAAETARFKAPGAAVDHATGQLFAAPISPAANGQLDGYFGSGATFSTLGALHHPMQYQGLPVAAGPASAPLPRVNDLPFTGPFSTHQASSSIKTAVAPQPSSPTSRSDNGSEVAASTGANLHVKEEGVPHVGGTVLASPADGSASVPAISQADAITALQVAHFQQQQFAAFAAAAAASQAQAGQNVQAWPLGGAFLF